MCEGWAIEQARGQGHPRAATMSGAPAQKLRTDAPSRPYPTSLRFAQALPQLAAPLLLCMQVAAGEAVHQFSGWADLKGRLKEENRRQEVV